MSRVDKISTLYSKIIFTIGIIFISRFGSYIPLPGIDTVVLGKIIARHQDGILGVLNMLSGGSLSRMSIFSLGIFPYITASIVMQLLGIIYPSIDQLKKEGPSGRRKISQYTRFLTIGLATFQSFGIASGLIAMQDNVVVISPILFKITAVITLVVGTVILMWLGEQITNNGIGNGSSLIIFAGIVSSLPGSLGNIFGLNRAGAISGLAVFFVIAIFILVLTVVVFIEKAHRRIPIQHPQKNVTLASESNNFIPMKVNNAGVVPPIFASSLLLFPITIGSFVNIESPVWQTIIANLNHGKPLFGVAYSILIFFFSFFYTSIIFNAEETANNLRKNGAYIPGKRPGPNTVEYLNSVLNRLTLIGASYLVLICLIPEVFMHKYSLSLTLGGTSLLIVVNVITDTMSQVNSYLYSSKYGSVVRKIKIRR